MVRRAIALSLALHAVALALLALGWPLLGDRAAPPPWQLTTWVASDDANAATATSPTDGRAPLPPPTEVELRVPADHAADAAHPGAPSDAPNPDPTAGAAAAASGHGPGAPTLVTDRADAATLRVQPYDAASGYQLQRIRTAAVRRSREEVRATPHPAATPWLASATHGDGHADADRARSAVAESVTGPDDEPDHAPPRTARADEAGQARPALAQAPASTESPRRSDDVSDRTESSLLSDEKHPAPLELSRPTSPGSGQSGQGSGALGFAPTASGAAPVPTGAPLPSARELALAAFQRAYDRYLLRIKQKVDPLWEFPRELAIRMEQGDVLVGFTIRKDGSVRDLRVLKASGFPSFDKNVLAAIKKAAPFDPLPETFGAELHVTAPFEGSNPAIQ